MKNEDLKQEDDSKEETKKDYLLPILKKLSLEDKGDLDEEAANLLKFQQAYQASSQIVSTANTIFDTILAAVR